MKSAKAKKRKDPKRQSSTSSEDDEAFTVPLSLAEEDVNTEHDMVVSSLAKPKRTSAGKQLSQPQCSTNAAPSPAILPMAAKPLHGAQAVINDSISTLERCIRIAENVPETSVNRRVQQSTNTTTSAFPREEVLSELQERLASTKLEEKPPMPYRSLRLSAGRREASRRLVPSNPANEGTDASHALDKLAGMVRADPSAWPMTAVCMALLYAPSRPRIMPRYSKAFWEEAAEATFGQADQ